MLVGKCCACDRFVELGDTEAQCPMCGAIGYYTEVQDVTPEKCRALLKPKPAVTSPLRDDFDYDAGSELFEDLGPGTTLNWLQYNVLVQWAFVGLTGLGACAGTFQTAKPPLPFSVMLSVMILSLIVSTGISVTAPRRDATTWHVTRSLVVVLFTVAQPITFIVLLFSGMDATPAPAAWPLAILWLLPWLLIVFGRPWRSLDLLRAGFNDPTSAAAHRLLVSIVAIALFALGASSLSGSLASPGPLDWRLVLFAVLPAPFALAVLTLQLASLPNGTGTPGPVRQLIGRMSLWMVRVMAIPLVGGLLMLVPTLILRGQHVWSRRVFGDIAESIGTPFLVMMLVLGAALVTYVAWGSAGTWKSSLERNPDEVPGLAGSILDIFFRNRV